MGWTPDVSGFDSHPASNSISTEDSLSGRKLSGRESDTYFHVKLRLVCVELYLHSPICIHGMALERRDKFIFTIQWEGKYLKLNSVRHNEVHNSCILTILIPKRRVMNYILTNSME